MNPDFDIARSNQSAFAQVYLEALRAVIACDDALANLKVRHTQSLLIEEETNPEIAAIKKELSRGIIVNLYGDHQYGITRDADARNHEPLPAGPWIKNQRLMEMIGRHVAVLGNEDDVAKFNHFAQKASLFFGQPYPATTYSQKDYA